MGVARRLLSLPGKTVAFWTGRPLLLAAVFGLVTAGTAFGGMRALTWMETPEFCGRCHTMAPEVNAHLNSPHETVECAECHVGKGLAGLVKAKVSGMRQMIKLVLGDYARPIPPAAHGMPSARETCLRCHDPGRQRQDVLITRSHFQEDEANTRQRVSLVVRLSGDAEQQTQGIHWHVLSDVEYLSRDEDGRVIDWIGVQRPDGTREEYISGNLVKMSDQAASRAAELRDATEVRRMSCYDCHNRVGHAFPSPGRAVDDAMQAGRIDPSIPYIKTKSVAVLEARYDSPDRVAQAITELAKSYHQDYPYLFLENPDRLERSLATLDELYTTTSEPVMGAYPEDYPSYLGHTDSVGCFRCHDGGHYKIVEGRLSSEAIPSRCSLCHTFPTSGPRAPSVMLGPPPSTHGARLWIFDHRKEANSADPVRANCSTCHSQAYCTNCHSTGAKQISHDNMLFDHAAVIRETTQQPCAYCHQKPFCERCHTDDELKDWKVR